MENLVNHNLFNNIYNKKTVLVTGHTGFKGSWLCLWLTLMGANVIGYSLNPPTEPNHFNLLDLNIISEIGDIRDKENLKKIFTKYQPEIVFHLAAQPLVRYSYSNPLETFETNIIGTINVFEACKISKNLKAIINITSDKCYENKEWVWGYREDDPMGGYDPYSSSKGCAELVTSCYRNSFFNLEEYNKSHNVLLASVRAGNVIGGGDWAEDRLIPDIMRAVSNKDKVILRNPSAVRPWQHVLEPLNGYLLLGEKLLAGKKEFAQSWNFGTIDQDTLTVKQIIEQIKSYWNEVNYIIQDNNNNLHEANLLKLDSSKAYSKLKWKSKWDKNTAILKTIEWYKNYYLTKNVISIDQLHSFIFA